eukprot:XP_019927454.1 PREDICTED: uncharacterized protein LOC109620150 isoform X2 [Crassostrea gigas]
MKKITKIKNKLIKKEEKMKQAENRTKEKIRRIMARLKGSKQKEAKRRREKFKTRRKMKVVPKTEKHGKIPENAAKIPFPKVQKAETKDKFKTSRKKEGTLSKTQEEKKHRHKMKIMPESGKHRKITEKVTKVPFQKVLRVYHLFK